MLKKSSVAEFAVNYKPKSDEVFIARIIDVGGKTKDAFGGYGYGRAAGLGSPCSFIGCGHGRGPCREGYRNGDGSGAVIGGGLWERTGFSASELEFQI